MHSKVVESLSLWILLLGASVGTSEKRNIETVTREDQKIYHGAQTTTDYAEHH